MSSQYKITDPAEQAVTTQPRLTRHPGVFIRDVLLPEHGLTKIAPLAERLKVNRPNLHEVLTGKRDVSRELAYRLGALLGDHVADMVIAYQQKWDDQVWQTRREELKSEIDRLKAAESS